MCLSRRDDGIASRHVACNQRVGTHNEGVQMQTETKNLQAVYTVIKKADGKDLWLRIGSAFPNRDGSLTVSLDAMPTNGRLQIREYHPRDGIALRSREHPAAREHQVAR
jgi:hypothetical protein